MKRILIADDHALVRKGLVQVVADAMDLEVAGEAATGSDVIDMLRSDPYDVVVLDLNMPGQSGLDTLKQINAEFEEIPILVLSMHSEEQYAVRVLRAGAAGYLTKESAPEQLVNAIRRVADGHRYLSPTAADLLIGFLDGDQSGPPHESLSDREFQVMKMLSSGKSVMEIGEILSLSVKTVSTYRSRVMSKMNMSSNAELARYALENDIIV
ncbi:MAG: response regulator transcription factor [Rhodothermales bacterium]|nr:response regulator transcription factor [Rhodothermales bacterium]